nr:unnamed protein product [Spirometra erinaceieuropaei]
MAAWNFRSLLDTLRSNRPERRTALVARELARYKVDIAALSETRFSEQSQLEEVGADYTFFWSSRPRAERRDAGVAFAIRNDIVGRLPSLPQGTNDRLLLPGGKFAIIVSVYALTPDDQPRRRQRQIIRGPARPLDDCVEGGQVDCPWNLRRTPAYPDQHLLPPTDSRKGHLDASSVATLAPAGQYSHPKARLAGRAGDKVGLSVGVVVADENASIENRWCKLRDTVQSTALVVLGYLRRQQQDWFDDDAAVSNLFAKKNRLHKVYVTRPADDNKAALYHSSRIVQQRLREMQDSWTAHKAGEIRDYVNRNELENFVSSIKAVCGPQAKDTAPLFSADGSALLPEKTLIRQRWVEHFRSVLKRR